MANINTGALTRTLTNEQLLHEVKSWLVGTQRYSGANLDSLPAQAVLDIAHQEFPGGMNSAMDHFAPRLGDADQEALSLEPGDRVEISPAADLWMSGARYGTVVSAIRYGWRIQMDRLPNRGPVPIPRHLIYRKL